MQQTTSKSANVSKPLSAEDLKKMREKDSKMVKGRFRSMEVPGATVPFVYKKYSGEVLRYSMRDGEIYTVPVMVAKHINANCRYPENAHLLDMNGNPMVAAGKYTQRFFFESLEFSDDEVTA